MPKKRIPQKWNALFRDYAFSVLVTIGSMALLFFCINSARTQATTERIPATKKAVYIPWMRTWLAISVLVLPMTSAGPSLVAKLAALLDMTVISAAVPIEPAT